MKKWTRSEPETVRPFFELTQAERMLDGTRFMLNEDDPTSESEIISIDPSEWQNSKPKIIIELDKANLCALLGERADRFNLILVARNPALKKRVLLSSWPITGEVPSEIPIDTKWLTEFTNLQVEFSVAICLARTNLNAPGMPSLTGSWISMKTFKLHSVQLRSQFSVEELTPDKAKEFRIDPGALIYVQHDGDINSASEFGLPIASVYLNSDVHKRWVNGKRNDALLNLVVTEAVSTVLMAARSEILDAVDVPEDVPLHRILKNLELSLDDMKDMLRGTPEIMMQQVRGRVAAVTGLPLNLLRM